MSSVSSILSSHLLFFGFFDDTHSDWNEIESQYSLICIFLMVKDQAKNFFVYLLVICNSSFEKHLFSSFVHSLSESLVLFVFNYLSFLYILDVDPLLDE
jgi:hypothetical protein